MNFLKKLFATGGSSRAGSYFYVRPKRCPEVVKVRVNLANDPSKTDDGGYYCRKIVRGQRCPFQAELHLYFDNNRRLIRSEVDDGELVTAEDYEAFIESAGTDAPNA